MTASDTVTFVPGTAASLTVVGITDPVVAGVNSGVTVTALDADSNTDTNYTGTVHFTSTDVGGSTVLPSDYTFLAGDNGVKVFDGVSAGQIVTLTTAE